MAKVYQSWVLSSKALGYNEARILTASPLAISAQPLPVISFMLADMFKLVRPVFTYKVLIEKALLTALLKWLETHGKQCAGQGSFRIVDLGSAWVESYL